MPGEKGFEGNDPCRAEGMQEREEGNVANQDDVSISQRTMTMSQEEYGNECRGRGGRGETAKTRERERCVTMNDAGPLSTNEVQVKWWRRGEGEKKYTEKRRPVKKLKPTKLSTSNVCVCVVMERGREGVGIERGWRGKVVEMEAAPGRSRI